MLAASSVGNQTMNSTIRTVVALLMWLPFAATLAQQNVAIDELMTAAELESTGVGTLSASERAALSAWLVKFQQGNTGLGETETSQATAVPATAPAQSDVTATEAEDDWRRKSEKIDYVTRIVGDFSGWDGDTQFTLENGQVWAQRRRSRWKINLENPQVRIYQNFLGAFEMEVIEAGRSIGVRRIR